MDRATASSTTEASADEATAPNIWCSISRTEYTIKESKNLNNSLCSVSHAIACGQVSLYVYDVCIHEFEDDLSSAGGNVTISFQNFTVKIIMS